ncbi:hypothetical protein J6590_056206 [Homalodisca vitripennis]|nr:hypothetical protein J6590_056206 [Homalodisca vitripennis]
MWTFRCTLHLQDSKGGVDDYSFTGFTLVRDLNHAPHATSAQARPVPRKADVRTPAAVLSSEVWVMTRLLVETLEPNKEQYVKLFTRGPMTCAVNHCLL